MSGHAMRWTYHRGYVSVEAVCNEGPDADCRLTSVSCECERWGEIRRTAGKIWHRIVDGSEIEPQWHEVVLQDACNICLFINESDCAEELGPTDGDFIVGELPIEPRWEDDGCGWDPILSAPDAIGGAR